MKAAAERECKHGDADHNGEENGWKKGNRHDNPKPRRRKNQEHSEATEAKLAPRVNETLERVKKSGRKGHVQMFKRTNKIKEAVAPTTKSKTELERKSTKTRKSVRAAIISRRNIRLTATLNETRIAVENTTTTIK